MPRMDTRTFMRRTRELSGSSWQDRGHGRYWIDHQSLTDEDAQRLSDARELTLWNVRLPPGFLGRLPRLDVLDLRGGTGGSLDLIRSAAGLRALVVNQVRGLSDLGALRDHRDLEFLSLYGLLQVKSLPALDGLRKLRRVELGQMRNLRDINALASLPHLEELYFSRRLGIRADDVKVLQGHPTLRAFNWFFEDIPLSQAQPVLEALPLERIGPVFPAEWLARRG